MNYNLLDEFNNYFFPRVIEVRINPWYPFHGPHNFILDFGEYNFEFQVKFPFVLRSEFIINFLENIKSFTLILSKISVEDSFSFSNIMKINNIIIDYSKIKGGTLNQHRDLLCNIFNFINEEYILHDIDISKFNFVDYLGFSGSLNLAEVKILDCHYKS